MVIAQVHRLLGSLDKHLSADKRTPQTELVLQRASDLAAKWPVMAISKQEELVRTAVKGVTLGQKHLWIEVDEGKLIAGLLGHTSARAADPVIGGTRLLKLTARLHAARRGAEVEISAPDPQRDRNQHNASLTRAIARGRVWYERLVTGEIRGMKQLAQQSGFKCRYIRKLLKTKWRSLPKSRRRSCRDGKRDTSPSSTFTLRCLWIGSCKSAPCWLERFSSQNRTGVRFPSPLTQLSY